MGESNATGQGMERVAHAEQEQSLVSDGLARGGNQKVFRRLSEALSVDQQRALGMITQGVSIKDAGQQLGIHRGTIYRWLKSDAYFRAAYNAWQLEQQESCRAALLKAAETAVKEVIEDIPYNVDMAWRLIKELGLLSRPKPGPTDPSRVELEIALERHEEETALMKRVDDENATDLASPRGDLGRLLRMKQDMELHGSQSDEPVINDLDVPPSPSEAMSRE